jgi:predicted O-linked N-acetylglucosamine transferase (SPINDLY family)
MLNKDNEIEDSLGRAREFALNGQVELAGKIFRDVLAIDARHPEANFWLGKIAADGGDASGALPHLLQALEADRQRPEFLIAYIDALVRLERWTEAEALIGLARDGGQAGAELDALVARIPEMQVSVGIEHGSAGYIKVQADSTTKSRDQQILPVQQDLDLILEAFQAGRFDRVISLSEDFIARFPGHDFGWRALGAGLQNLGRFEEAIKPMRKAVELAPADPEALFNLGVAQQVAGRFDEAETTFRGVLEREPQYVDALVNLGILLHAKGQFQQAADVTLAALSLRPNSIPALRNLGFIHQSLELWEEAESNLRCVQALAPGNAQAFVDLANLQVKCARFDAAEASCRDAIRIEPLNASHFLLLASVAQQSGQNGTAEESLRRALELDAGNLGVLDVLGRLYRETDRLELARDVLRTAAELAPDDPERWINLGVVVQELGMSDEAEQSYRRALAINSRHAQAQFNLGVVLEQAGRLDEALERFQSARKLSPKYVQAHVNCGNVLRDLGRISEGEDCFRDAIKVAPADHAGYLNLGFSLEDCERNEEAIASYQQGLECSPSNETLRVNLARVLGAVGRSTESLAISDALLELNPENGPALVCRSVALYALGRARESQDAMKRALEIDPGNSGGRSAMLFQMSELSDTSPEELFAEHRRFGEILEAPYRENWPIHDNLKQSERSLRIGFVSADLRDHTLAFFAEPILAELSKFPDLSLHAFYNHAIEDDTTAVIRKSFKQWHRIAGLPDKAVFELIQNNGIDILIDLSGHTRGSRLDVFARKPAPVQASWIGYPATTGLTSIDYYLGDRFFIPQDKFASQFSEALVHLPSSVSFRPFQWAPAVNALPALSNGFVTFGSFNRPSKISHHVVRLWSRLMLEVPGSRLILAGLAGGDRTRTLVKLFADHGIEKERLLPLPRMVHESYQALHLKVDMALDTFPYAGGTTTLHALWMGVPTLTMDCGKPASRQGAFSLGHVGLEQFVVGNEDDFVLRGRRLAADLSGLAEIRASLRTRFAESALADSGLIASGLHQALRIMWRRWCEGLPPEFISVSGR